MRKREVLSANSARALMVAVLAVLAGVLATVAAGATVAVAHTRERPRRCAHCYPRRRS